jgi:hypothetical protein
MTDQYLISENGYFFTDINAPTPEVASFGDLNPPAPPPFIVPEPGVTTLDDGNVVEYEDDEMLMNYFVYDVNNKLVSYLETNKSTGVMIQYVFTRTAGPALEAIGSNEDYQNFAATGQIDDLGDDVPNASIENYSVTEILIASIGPEGELIPA